MFARTTCEEECISDGSDPCFNKACGETCSTCPPGEACPAVEEYCNAEGECTAEQPQCEDLCADFIPPCDDSLDCPDGMECSFEGCNPSSAFCDPETGEIVATADCSGGMCVPKEEDPCNLIDCAPGYFCNSDTATCEYDACAGLSCGELCKPCDPEDADCAPGGGDVLRLCGDLSDGLCVGRPWICVLICSWRSMRSVPLVRSAALKVQSILCILRSHHR